MKKLFFVLACVAFFQSLDASYQAQLDREHAAEERRACQQRGCSIAKAKVIGKYALVAAMSLFLAFIEPILNALCRPECWQAATHCINNVTAQNIVDGCARICLPYNGGCCGRACLSWGVA